MPKDNAIETLPSSDEIATLAFDDHQSAKAKVWQLRWAKWIAWTKQNIHSIDANVLGALQNLKKKHNLLKQQKTTLNNQLQQCALDDTEKSKKLDHNLEAAKQQRSKLETKLGNSDSGSPISMRFYYITVAIFGVIEAPLNYLAFQEDSPNLAALGVLVAALGIVLGLGAHFVGTGLKQFPKEKGDKSGRFWAFCWVAFWLVAIFLLFFGINYYRDTSSTMGGGGMFWLIMLVNLLLFSAVTFFAYRKHDSNAARHEKRVKLNKLESDIDGIQEDQIEEDDDTEEKLEENKSTIQQQIDDTDTQLTALKGEYERVLVVGIASQKQALGKLKSSIATYKQEYATITDDVPHWDDFSAHQNIEVTLKSQTVKSICDATAR